MPICLVQMVVFYISNNSLILVNFQRIRCHLRKTVLALVSTNHRAISTNACLMISLAQTRLKITNVIRLMFHGTDPFLLGSFRLRLISGLFQRWGKSLLYMSMAGTLIWDRTPLSFFSSLHTWKYTIIFE